jgi:histidinol-phosphate/aromatic aminotransferase/cobyric acid decarboxylase-like protein
LQGLLKRAEVEKTIAEIVAEREKLIEKLQNFHSCEKIYPTDANFVLVKTTDANAIYNFSARAKKSSCAIATMSSFARAVCELRSERPEENESFLKNA